MTRVIGVLGGSGGVGASTFAAVLAATAGAALLVDLDGTGGGVDVRLGIEDAAGARWSGLRLAGGRLTQRTLLDGLPTWGPCAVLAADVAAVDAGALGQVIDAATDGPALDAVVLDLPRWPCPERATAVPRCDLVVVLARGCVPGLVAAHATVGTLPDAPLGLVLRRGEVPPPEAARLIAAPLLGTLDPLTASSPVLDPHRLPRALRRVVGGVLAGVRSAPAAAA